MEKPISKPPKRKLRNEEVAKYDAMVERFIRSSCMKNWTESKLGSDEIFLGNTGMSLADLRQHLRTEVCVALHNYNPQHIAKNGRSVKESTFVYQHLTFRVGQMMKRLTKRRCGYGLRHAPIDPIISHGMGDPAFNLDLDLSIDKKREVQQVQRFLEKKLTYESEDMRDQ